MNILEELIKEFWNSHSEYIENITVGEWSEAALIKSYLMGIIRGMTVICDMDDSICNEDRLRVESCINNLI